MKRVLGWLMTAVLVVSLMAGMSFTAQAEGTTYDLADCADKVKLVGRVEVTEDGVVPHTTASGIAFYTDAVGDVTMTISGGDGYCQMFDHEYFIVYLDGEEYKRLELPFSIAGKTGVESFVIAEDLDGAVHRIEVLRETEEVNARALYQDITLDGELMPVPEAPMMIEFIGDSITTGYGAYPVTAESKGLAVDDPIRQAGTKSYAYLTAMQLGMDIQVCCTSGYGAVCGYNANDANLLKMYPYTAYHNGHDSDDDLWGFKRTADIVVINLGTNDRGVYRTKGYTDADMAEGFRALMELAREKNPDAKVVWVTGMMGISFKGILEDEVAALGGAENGYFFCELPKGTSGGAGHPDGEEHQAAAEVLTQFLKDEVLAEDYLQAQISTEKMDTLLSVAACLPGCDTSVAKAELRAAKANDYDAYGTLNSAYYTLRSDVIKGAMIIGVVLIVVAAGLVAFAVLYKPKKKEEVTARAETDSQHKE